jgi:hypothetical protein
MLIIIRVYYFRSTNVYEVHGAFVSLIEIISNVLAVSKSSSSSSSS